MMEDTRPFERDVMRSLGRIEGKVEGILIEQKKQKKDMERVTKRVGALEKYRAKVAGLAAAVGAGIGYVVNLFSFK